MSDVELPPWLMRYLTTREKERNDDTDNAFASMTPTERGLVKDSAVMGYVQGFMAATGGRPPDQITSDARIVRKVISECRNMPDLYPTMVKITDREDQEW